jgi:hypothetical protein
MDRRRFLLTSLVGVLAAPLAAGAPVSPEWPSGYADRLHRDPQPT